MGGAGWCPGGVGGSGVGRCVRVKGVRGPWDVHGPWGVRRACVGRTWGVRGAYVGRAWGVRGASVGRVWGFLEAYVLGNKCKYHSRRFIIRIPW